MVGKFDPSLRPVWHVAVCTSHSAPCVDTCQINLVIRMLGFQHRGPTQAVGPVTETDVVVVFLHIFDGKSVIPGKGEVGCPFDHRRTEVIFHVTLGAYETAHFLMGGLVDVPAHTLVSFNKSRPAYAQVHGFFVMAIGTADWVYHLRPKARPLSLVELADAHLVHETRNVRAFAGPAGGGLWAIVRAGGPARAQGIININYGIIVAPRLLVIARKAVTRP